MLGFFKKQNIFNQIGSQQRAFSVLKMNGILEVLPN